MKLANLRKEYLLSGQEFPEIPKNKVITDYIAPPRVPKGHKHEREKEVRQKKIKDAMAKMPKMIADWKKVCYFHYFSCVIILFYSCLFEIFFFFLQNSRFNWKEEKQDQFQNSCHLELNQVQREKRERQ